MTSTDTRSIARAAVRAELASVAFDLFVHEGFDRVTITDLAAATGVSRSTFLRYFGTKEEAALVALDVRGEHAADAVRARPAAEDDWTALRRSLDTIVEGYREDPGKALVITRLVRDTPALCSRWREKQHSWRPALAQALAERHGSVGPIPLALSVRAAAALDCLDIAIDEWTASDGRLDLVDLLDEAFAALNP